MASLAAAALPSSDEEDDDYDPTADPTGEKEDRPGAASKQGSKRRRGVSAGADGEAADGEADEADGRAAKRAALLDDEETELTPAQAAKKAKFSAMFEQLHQASTGSTNKLSKSTISLASLCSNTDPKKKRNTDLLWMRNLGLTGNSSAKRKPAPASGTAAMAANGAPGTAAVEAAAAGDAAGAAGASSEQAAGDTVATVAAAGAGSGAEPPGSSSGAAADASAGSSGVSAARAAAAAALAAAKEASTGGVGRSYNKVTITETRRFAGKDLQVTVQVDKDSKEAKKAAEKSEAAASGLDAFLQQIESKKKVSVLDKSKMDWQDFKSTDKEVQEELDAHSRSDKQYLDRQEFLKRAELREYELERDKRLASDVRLRGRL